MREAQVGPRPVHMEVRVNKTALGQVFLHVLQFFLAIIIPVMLDTHIAFMPYITSAVGSVIK